MKGVFHGLKVSQFSLILIAFVCATVVFLAWTKTPLLTALTATQSVVQIDQVAGEGANGTFNQDAGAVIKIEPKQVDTAVSSGKEPAVDEGNSNNTSELNSSSELIELNQADSPNSSGKEPVVEAGNSSSPTAVEKKEMPVTVTGSPRSEEVSEGKYKSKQTVDRVVTSEVASNPASSPIKEQSSNQSFTTKKEDCKYAQGKWVIDDTRPLYSGFGCKQWLSSMWACRLTQRTDFEYEKLRWQPKECKMEDFTGPKFLKRMQDKTLAFVGDSLGRQQFQSLMCMATGGEERSDVLDVGREYGLVKARGAIRPDGWAYRFPNTNTTILYYWSASLTDLQPVDAANPATNIAMHLDRPPAFLRNFLHKFNVLVLNTGHHWNRGKINANRWVMYVGGQPNTNRKIADINGAKNFTIHSIVKWVDSQLPLYPGLKSFFRTISPRHFFNGDWNTGGTCDNTTPMSGRMEVIKEDSSDPQIAGAVSGTGVKLLDVTGLSELRDEGHISRYSIKSTPGMQDCLHWCLPGVPDTWNEILFAQL